MFTVAVSQAGQQMRPQAFSFMYFFIFFLDFVIYVISQFPHRSIAPGVLRTADVFPVVASLLRTTKKYLVFLITNTFLVLAKQQLCTCITLFCKFISRRCTIET